MRKIIHSLVLFSFISQQVIWAVPLPWKPDFESASVLPCHVDGLGRRWVLLSKKTYKDTEYDAPSWGDFGGKVEEKDGRSAVATAVRELDEETAGQITTSPEELMRGSFHQLDMAKSPFGDKGVRRHTIFFKMMDTMFMPNIEVGIDQGPTQEGGCEVAQYQWVLASDLLKMQVPGIFGHLLGLYTPETLRVETADAAKEEYFSVPFFVLLQQAEVKRILRHSSHIENCTIDSVVDLSCSLVPRNTQTFSQIVFTKHGFQDWRLVRSGQLNNEVLDASYEAKAAQPRIIWTKVASNWKPDIEFAAAHSPDDSDLDSVKSPSDRARLFRERFEQRVAASNARQRVRDLQQALTFDPEAIQEEALYELAEAATEFSAVTPSPIPTIKISFVHNPLKSLENCHYIGRSLNAWEVDSLETPFEDKDAVQKLMRQYTLYSSMLQQLCSGVLALKVPQAQPEKVHPKILPLQAEEVLDVQKYSREVATLKAKVAPVVAPVAFPFDALSTMTDSQLRHLLGDGVVDLKDTNAILKAYQAKVKLMRPFTTAMDTITHPSFVASVAAVLAEERDHPEMFTAYHGCTAEIHFLNTVYAALRKALGLPERAVNWRLFDSTACRYGNISTAFSDTAQSTIQDAGFLNPFEVLIAGNAALTGNPEDDGCRTLTYWKNSHSEASLDLRHVLNDVLIGIGINAVKAVLLANQLYGLYESSYLIDDPEPSVDSAPRKRRVGILRQIFIDPKSAEEQLALSGHYFDHPLSFADRQKPDGTVVSIYNGLEEDDNTWMKELPDVLRFMAHVRAGHSITMEHNIKAYHAQTPNGLRPFNLLDYEVRLFTGQDPALVRTHFYPASSADSSREETVTGATLELIGDSLQGIELPIRSFHDFNKTHQLLQAIIRNQLGIKVAPAPVSLEQFKAAVAQGDREAMEVYLSDLRTHEVPIEAVDVISNETRSFTVADYVAMVAMRHHMAGDTIIAVSKKHNLFSGHNVHPTETPFALYGLFYLSGLNGLQQFGWNGDLAANFRVANTKEASDPTTPGDGGAAKARTFSGEFYTLTIKDLMNTLKTKDTVNFLRDIASKTDYSRLPPTFWANLVATGNIGLFLGSGLLDNVNIARWNAIVAGFSAAGIDEAILYANYRDTLLEIFHSKKILDTSTPYTIASTYISKATAERILRGLVSIHGKDAILAQLKTFETNFGFSFVTEEDVDDNSPIPHQARQVYEVFKSVDLVDNTWKEFFNQLTNVRVIGKEDELVDDVISIMQDGCTGFDPHSLCWLLREASASKLRSCLGNPLLSDVILEGFGFADHIEESAKFSPHEKKALHRQLYDLAYQKSKLTTIKTIPAEVAEWFAALSEDERLAVSKSSFLNARMIDLLDLPSAYVEEGSISALRRELFPTEAPAAIDFMLKSVDMPSRRSIEWLRNLLKPYILEAFTTVLERPDSVTPFATALFVTSGMQVPDDYPAGSLATLTRKLYSESVLLLSPVQIIDTLKCPQRWIFGFSSFPINDLITARLESIKATVKESLAGDAETKEALRRMVAESQYMSEHMKTFLGFVSVD